jgi:aryl-alcohol dehydrogenase-like predicted oxidoreductase
MNERVDSYARVGLGTYRGAEDPATDEMMCDIVQLALRLGVRMVDTAVNYRSGRSERAIGQALALSLNEGIVRREDVIVCTKTGFTRPAGSEFTAPPAPEPHGPLDHCFRPECLRYQLDLSLRTLGIDMIDVYYLHNPEQQRSRSSPEEFRRIMAEAFEVLEKAVAEGLIGAYGIATWTAVRDDREWSLASLKALAGQVAADTCGASDHFSFVQAPLSIGMREALVPGHDFQDERVSLVRLCESLGLRFVASASGGGGRVAPLVETSVRWVRTVPGVHTALVGTLAANHLAALVRDIH